MAEKVLDVAKESTSQEILSKVANGVAPSFRSPISIKTGSVNKNASATASGTGKGILYVTGSTLTIVIDGVTVLNSGDTGDYDIGYTFGIEFTQSFNITTADYNPAQYMAVFY